MWDSCCHKRLGEREGEEGEEKDGLRWCEKDCSYPRGEEKSGSPERVEESVTERGPGQVLQRLCVCVCACYAKKSIRVMQHSLIGVGAVLSKNLLFWLFKIIHSVIQMLLPLDRCFVSCLIRTPFSQF